VSIKAIRTGTTDDDVGLFSDFILSGFRKKKTNKRASGSALNYFAFVFSNFFQSYGSRVPWEDPSDWVIKTYPWSSPSSNADSSSDWPPLLRLRPEDVGYDSTQSVGSSAVKPVPQPAPSDSEANDPLVSFIHKSELFLSE
jgi:hypothetical protein